ncbi:MAG: flagellar motor switch protein FliG [bacterium]|nr:flagellar motor switch protein FliG [bacterium]
MKPIHEMTGAERAAALLIALGREQASAILQNFDEEEIEKISIEIAKIEGLSPIDQENLVGEFLIDLKKSKNTVRGGEEKAKDILTTAFGKEKAAELLGKMEALNLEKGFEFLADIDPEVLVSFLKDEHPQTITVTLSHLPAPKSAAILRQLPRPLAKEIAIRMAKMTNISPEAVVRIAETLKKRYNEFLEKGNLLSDLSNGGINSLVNILGHLPGEDEKRLMEHFDSSVPDISKEIRNKIFTFEAVVTLTNTEMRVLIDEINDDILVAKALKGAGDDIRFKFVRNMSRNRATDVVTELGRMGPLRLSEIDDCRSIIVGIMRELNDSGVITLRRDGEVYVE